MNLLAEEFDPEIWEPNPEKPGYLRFVKTRTVGELFDYCKAALEPSGILDQLEYFDLM